jgi:hypothetical protein
VPGGARSRHATLMRRVRPLPACRDGLCRYARDSARPLAVNAANCCGGSMGHLSARMRICRNIGDCSSRDDGGQEPDRPTRLIGNPIAWTVDRRSLDDLIFCRSHKVSRPSHHSNGFACVVAHAGQTSLARIERSSITARSRCKAETRRGGRVAEGARLESVYTGNRIAGSNPASSAMSLILLYILPIRRKGMVTRVSPFQTTESVRYGHERLPAIASWPLVRADQTAV